MPLDSARLHPLQCLTLDGLSIGHAEQARQLCAAGARWIQYRSKVGSPAERLAEACAVAAVCRSHGAVCIVNDSAELALRAGSDGAHLGPDDGDWREARRLLGPDRILGGTVNDEAAARRAVGAGCLDYAGIGPLRFTSTKARLAPRLGIGGIRTLVEALRPIPAWAIGGVEPADLPDLRAAGVAGVAVSSALFRGSALSDNVGAFLAAWNDDRAGVARVRVPAVPS